MLSKTTTYWLAGLGVVGVAAAAPIILKYYHVWPGAADAPVTLVAPKTADVPAAPAPPNAAPAPMSPAAQAGPATPAPVSSAEPAAAAPPPRTEVATNNPAPPAQPAPGAKADQQPPAPAAEPSAPAPVAPSPSAKADRPPTAPSPSAKADKQPPTSTAPPSAAAPAPAAPSPPAPSAAAKPDQQRPAFDVVRVEPTGDAVIAGRASPRAAVQLRSDGQVVAQVDADDSGQFAILPPPFSAGGHRLQLAARSGGSSEVLSDAIGIEVPYTAEAAAPNPAPAPPKNPPPAVAKPAAAAPAKPAEAARAEKPAPPKVAAAAEALKAPTPAPAKVAALDAPPAGAHANQPVVSILSVEASGTGRLEAKGAAEPNAIVRLYLNNTYVAEAIAGADGRWSLTVEHGMTPGAYAIRADEIDHASGAVVARAEVPFNYPDHPTPAQVAAAAPPRAPTPPSEKPVTDQPAPAGATAAAPTPQAAQDSKPSGAAAATPAPQPAATPQPAPAPRAAQPSAKNEAPQTPTSAPPAAETAPEQPKAGGTDVPAKNSGAPAPSAAQTEAAATRPSAPTSAPAAEPPAVTVAEPPKPADGANPVVPEIRTTKVVPGDNLWNLSKHFYGYGPNYKVIYEANSSQIRNPRLIYPDQIFVVPPKPND